MTITLRDDRDLPPAEVAARFRWAKTQGNPAWLWPDITPARWQAAMAAIAPVVAGVLGGGVPVLAGDAAAIGLAGYTSGTGPLLGHWHRAGLLHCAPDIADELALQLDHNAVRSARMLAATARIGAAFDGAGVAAVLLKGAHTATRYFPTPATRPASDIDLLIAPADAPAAEAILRDLGFGESGRSARESSWRPAGAATLPRSLAFVHADDPWTIDLHVSLDIAVGPGAPVARFDRARPIETAAPAPLRVLPQPLLALHIAAHAGAGLHNLTLLRLIELALIVRADDPDWRDFLTLGDEIAALGFAYPALRLCEQLVPGTIPAAVLDRCAARAAPAARRIVARLTPATAHRIARGSLSEHFMWTTGAAGWARQLAADLFPADFRTIYERRLWQIVRGRVTR